MTFISKIHTYIYNIFQFITDFVFPPTKIEIELRNILYEDFINKVNRAPDPPFNFIKSIFAYKDPLVKELIWQIKYKKNKKALSIAGRALYMELIKDFGYEIVLVPIPISKKRRRERGYNQCEIIIDEILRNDTTMKLTKNFNILKRIVHKERQTLKNRYERLTQAKNIFEASLSEEILNKKIVIIDDVVTTGSTAKEARNVMLKAGYRDIEVLSLAR